MPQIHRTSIARLAPYTDNISEYYLTKDEDVKKKLEEKYSEELLAEALQLKANIKEYIKAENKKIKEANKGKPNKEKQPLKHFDDKDTLGAEYYIKLAQNFNIESLMKSSLAISKNRIIGCPIQDSKWAGFSYEEIIEMENNGCVIPQEVLAWAHAQQEADVTNYIIISDNTTSDDETSKEDNDINSLKKKVQQYVTQSENAIETSEKLFEEFTLKTEKANQIKKEKEDTYKDQMSEISELTKEWKQLDEKNKSGSLNESEKKRYTELGKQLNGSNGTKMKEVKNTQKELDDFLDSIDGMNTQVTQNTQLSNDTTNAAKELSKLTRHFANFVMPHDKKENVVDNGLLSNSLQNVKGDEIAITALKTVENLDETTNEINDTLSDSANVELAEFSNEYSDLASKTEENTKNTMGDDYDKASENNDEENPERKEQIKNKDKYHVAKVFSYINANIATATTIAATVDLKKHKQSTETSEKDLTKEMKKAAKDIKELDKETTKIEQRKEAKVEKEEQFLEELDAINEKQTAQQIEENTNTESDVNLKDKQADIEDQTDKKESIMSEMATLDTEDNELTKGLSKTLAKSKTSTLKSNKLSKLLRGEAKELVKINNNAEKVASDTIFVGIGTTSQSIITGNIGVAMCTTGATMMSSIYPPTVLAGMKLFTAGVAFLNISALEFASGTLATVTGATTLAISANAKDTNNDATSLEKEANQTVKENNAQMKDSTQAAQKDNQNETNNITAQPITTNTDTDTSTTSETTTDETSTQTVDEQNQDIKENIEDETEKNTEGAAEQNKTEEENPSTETTENKEEQEKDKQQSSSYEVDLKFGHKNAQKATQTTQQATSEVLQTKEDTTSDDNKLTKEMKNIDKLTKQNKKNEKQAETIHKKFVQKAEQAILKIEESDSEIKNGLEEGNEEKVASSQIDIENNITNLDSITQEETKSTATINKNITKITSNLKTSQKDAKSLSSDINEYNKLLKNQLNVSAKTTIVGGGTIRKGVLEEIDGINKITEGTPLLSNPLTHLEGVVMIAKGTKKIIDGTTNIAFGTEATVTGILGIAENIIANNQKETVEKNTKNSTKEINTKNKDVQEDKKNAKEKENETKSYTEEITSIAASASSNANTNDNTKTDDKEDRRLTRFNEDSMIESKKKKKKVMAVSASSRG